MSEQVTRQGEQASPGSRVSVGERRRVFRPRVNVWETPEAIFLVADMPGVDETTAEVTLDRDVLTIRGRVHWEPPVSHRPVHSEFGMGDYLREFSLNAEVDADNIQAQVRNGVLRVALPRARSAGARRIEVKGG